MTDIANQVGPGYAVGAFDEPGVCDGPEGLADVGRVGDVAVSTEEDGSDAGRVGGVAKVRVRGFFRTGFVRVSLSGSVDERDGTAEGSVTLLVGGAELTSRRKSGRAVSLLRLQSSAGLWEVSPWVRVYCRVDGSGQHPVSFPSTY